MSEFLAFVQLGFRHITDPNGLDHVLFLLVLAAVHPVRDWRGLLAVITAFTVGHSLTLALTVTGVLVLPAALIEFLIPVTIVATSVGNLLTGRGATERRSGAFRLVLAATFGLVHGAGFANYLRSLFVDRLAVPLLGFNVGIELGQIAVLLVTLAVFAALDRAIGLLRTPDRLPTPVRLRAIAVSCVVAVIAAGWALERQPW